MKTVVFAFQRSLVLKSDFVLDNGPLMSDSVSSIILCLF
jgi:hypothetical protein